ncbi:hypothetical protein [Xanthomonas hortorum]|jgi:hypothetical protein|uniref:Uncharacterized protein n=2 Tax=Xanthomonas hortorum TaxID=56454 RepID=A0A6V7C2K5_9XANT|nr:hypothetical protein [Xanthomonas hortorum]NMI51152.1 hypothetical protein [Xanthomonas hortorum pv. taraxaci]APP78875.1 hypothetical protein BJD10_03440 [Xanthomonas hortorum pv. gardneri]APP83074.1 hypothetical protein BI317_01650 [Xanthomonas hortorum pv. gardneri]MCC8499669.1 hypothetical protein [Xanthomonas hortorum pv. gardneri]MCC8508460.1 hypothetical protein [Xanthomonas hortorum pv. gardneri]
MFFYANPAEPRIDLTTATAQTPVSPVARFSADKQGVPQSSVTVTITSIQPRGNQDMSFGNDPQRAYWGGA